MNPSGNSKCSILHYKSSRASTVKLKRLFTRKLKRMDYVCNFSIARSIWISYSPEIPCEHFNLYCVVKSDVLRSKVSNCIHSLS